MTASWRTDLLLVLVATAHGIDTRQEPRSLMRSDPRPGSERVEDISPNSVPPEKGGQSPFVSGLRGSFAHSFSPNATAFVEASNGFLVMSECFDKWTKTGLKREQFSFDDEIRYCHNDDFLLDHLNDILHDDADTSAELLTGLEFPGNDSALDVNHRKFIAFTALARNVATLFASRQAGLALRTLERVDAKHRRELLLHHQSELERAMQSAMPWLFYFGELSDPDNEEERTTWKHAKRIEFDLRSLLHENFTRELLDSSMGRILKLDWSALAAAYALPQKSRIATNAAGTVTKESSLDLGQDQQGNRILMPMIGLGTGFSDCVDGQIVDGDQLTREPCDTRAPAGWISKLSLVDTAASYGTESMVGLSLQESNRPRSELFVMTKVPVEATWPLWRINKGIDLLEHQLQNLRTPYVDALLLHHDAFNRSEWNSLEDVVEQGKARIIGVSGISAAREVQKCMDTGGCKRGATLAEELWSPCASRIVPKEVPAGTSLVATSAVWTCSDEPHVANIARQKGVDPAVVGIRWAMQTGVPVLVQTQRANHLESDLTALDIELSDEEMGMLSLLPMLYRLWSKPNQKVLKAME